jgi:hypothetical protein
MRPDTAEKPPRSQPKVRLLTLASLDGRTKARRTIKQRINAYRVRCGGRFTVEQAVAAERAAILAALLEHQQVRMLRGEDIGLQGLSWFTVSLRHAERDLEKLIEHKPKRTRGPRWAGPRPETLYDDNE